MELSYQNFVILLVSALRTISYAPSVSSLFRNEMKPNQIQVTSPDEFISSEGVRRGEG